MSTPFVAGVDVSGPRGRTEIVVGGAPVSEAFAREIAVDGYAGDATSAAARVRGLDQEVV